MNFPPHGQRTQIQGAFGRCQRFMDNTAIMHISSHIYKRCRQAYTGDTSEENPYLRAFDRSNDQLHMTWCWKNRNPSLPPLSVLPFMTHDKAGDLLKSSRGEREVWKNGSKSHLWNSVRSGLLTTPRFRITYAITSLSTNCMETHLCVGEQFPSVLSILKSKSGLRDKNGRKDSCCRVALAIQNIMGRVVHWHPMLNYQQLGELQGPCYILSLVQNALIWWNNEWGNVASWNNEWGNVEVPHGLHTINRSLIKVRT